MNELFNLLQKIKEFSGKKSLIKGKIIQGQIWIEIFPSDIRLISKYLKNIDFTHLIDIVGIDYLHYGYSYTNLGEKNPFKNFKQKTKNVFNKRFGIIYHLLSTKKNIRLSFECLLDEKNPYIESVIEIWENANWHEREIFDMFGIIFKNHPDLRRILTDYGFIGYPFRKDFPISGNVEIRYDKLLGRIVYEPVNIKTPNNSPKVIRNDNRYYQYNAKD